MDKKNKTSEISSFTRSAARALNSLKVQFPSLFMRFFANVSKNTDPDEITVIELEALGFKIYPPDKSSQ